MSNPNQKQFTLGVDGEFVMLDQNKELVCMSDFLDKDGDFGIDDHGKQCTVEIRSKPSVEPLEIVQSIRATMQETLFNVPDFLDFDWVCGSFIKTLPLGTHIHFGCEKGIMNAPDIAILLDNYVGAITVLLENKKQGLARRKYSKTPAGNNVSYGKISDVRYINHRRLYRWEYRACSSFLNSPHITNAILSLTKVVVHECLNNPNFRPIKYIEADDFIKMDTEKIMSHFPAIWEDITSMSLYPTYHKAIDIIYYLVTNNPRLSWELKNQDMKTTWGITYDSSLDLNKPSFKKIWKDYLVPAEEIEKLKPKKPIVKTNPFKEFSLDNMPVIYNPNRLKVYYGEPIGLVKPVKPKKQKVVKAKLDEEVKYKYEYVPIFNDEFNH